MSATDDVIIEDLIAACEVAYNEIENAIRNLHTLGVAESAILLSVRIIYRSVEDEVLKE